jgi:hypothetical protein
MGPEGKNGSEQGSCKLLVDDAQTESATERAFGQAVTRYQSNNQGAVPAVPTQIYRRKNMQLPSSPI